jgi:hypothetical protein
MAKFKENCHILRLQDTKAGPFPFINEIYFINKTGQLIQISKREIQFFLVNRNVLLTISIFKTTQKKFVNFPQAVLSN